MSVKALQEYTRFAKYAKFMPNLKRRETWDEQVSRVFDMHRKKLGLAICKELEEEIDFAEKMMRNKRVLGSQRALQFGGKGILDKHPRLYNCSASYVDRPRFFQECIYLLLCGCGVGFSVQKHHIEKLPEIRARDGEEVTYVIPDSIEGWSDALGILMSSYFVGEDVPFKEYQGKIVKFDYKLIRPAGSPLSSGGKAPGPDGLHNTIDKIVYLMDKFCKLKKKLEPIDAYDIIMYCCDAVLSGGIRRCLPIGSLVHTKKGLIPIEKVEIGMEVLTAHGYHPIANKFDQGEQATIIIKTQDGEFECTQNHKMAVMNSCNSYEWKMAKDLKSGDRLISTRTPIDGSKQALPEFTYNKPKHSSTCKDIVIPELDNKIAWLIGLVHADGYVWVSDEESDYRGGLVSITVGLNEINIAIEAKKQLERFGINVVMSDSKTEKSIKIVAKSRQLAEYFYEHIKQPNIGMNIPNFIMKSSCDIRLSYIAGMIDGDGCVKNRPVIMCSTVYPIYAKQLQSLCYSCGIETRINVVKSKEKELNKWQTQYTVAAITPHTIHALINIPELFKRNEIKVRKFSRGSNSFKFEWFDKSIKHKNKMGRKNTINVDTLFKFNPQVNNGYIPVKVIDVEDGRNIQTFDIEVKAEHSFFCNGYLTHNSATISLFSPDDEQMIKAKTGSWFIDNPQRGRSNNSALIVRSETTKEQFLKIFQNVKEFGEPGFIFSDDRDYIFNPCSEILLVPKLQQDNTELYGWGFCLTKDDKVLTKKGYVAVENLPKKFSIISQYENDTVDYKSNSGFTNNSATLFSTGIKDVYYLETISGYNIKLTSNHPILTQDGYKTIQSINIESDRIVSAFMDSDCNDATKQYNMDNYQCNEFDLMGWWTGDGWFLENGRMGLVFGSPEDKFAKEQLVPVFNELVSRIDGGKYGNRYNHIPYFRKDLYGVITYTVQNEGKQKVIMDEFGIKTATAPSKKIMDCYWLETRDNKARFISALFSADGCVIQEDKKISLTCANNVMAKEIQLALSEFGIVSRIGHYISKETCKQHSIVYIGCAHDIVLFRKHIGFRMHPRKQATLEAMSWEKLGSFDRRLHKIRTIKYIGQEEVFDISVKNTRNFICNGIVVHNCNLCEINVKKAKTKEEFYAMCRAAAIIGTIQSSYTDFPYLGEVTENIVKGEALLGVSMTGMADNPEISFNEKIQQEGAGIVLSTNEKIAKIIGINPCLRSTCIKPAGSTSCLLGTASGIHPHHAKRYFRRVQANKLETPLQYFQKFNPAAVEESVWSNNKTDMVITFLCEVPEGARTKNQMDALSLLENVKLTQQNWIEYGTRHDKSIWKNARHNVSNTISVKSDEWDSVAEYIYKNRKWFAGISLLPIDGDKDYPQAPFTAVFTPNEIVKEYGDSSIFASGLIVDGVREFNNNLWAACDCVLDVGETLTVDALRNKIKKDYETNGVNWKNEGLNPSSPEKLLIAWLEHNVVNFYGKIEWIRRAKQFAIRYFKGDVRLMTYCLKDVSNWKTWCDLGREYKDIEWGGCYEDVYGSLTSYGGEAGEACSGGACLLGELGASIKEKQRKVKEE